MIYGVQTRALSFICDERGRLMVLLRSDDPVFQKFGQVYLTTTNPGVVKAWHLHHIQTDLVSCIRGEIELVLFDARETSPTVGEVAEFAMGEERPLLISIPPGIYHGWKCVSNEEAFIINVPTEPYKAGQPDEFRLPPDTDEIPYRWILTPGKRHG
ncbi:MAG: dTDP-4-dehydrorhamnose 3,5-epimerase family protein [Methanomicrobiales archaeon]|jgi:dTDP-4-dehydrorhamnose 3,5-epimerase|nr:dTDP-4-dehydrorhamnose 3,5-epimerase family protein [Methanomicrobiales archaeon]